MKQLLILSGKGGTGKTTVASAFIKLAHARAYADCDVDSPNLHLIMNHTVKPETSDYYGLPKAEIDSELCVQCDMCREYCRYDAIIIDSVNKKYKVDKYACEGCGVCEAVCMAGAVSLKPETAGRLMLYVDDNIFSTAELNMGNGTSGMLVTEVKKQVKTSAPNAEIIIIDGSPGIGCPVIASISGADMVLIVAEPTMSGISDMERIIKTAEKFHIKIAVCINKYDTNIVNTEKIELFCKKNDIIYAGRIPFDPNAVKAINSGQSIVDIDCEAGNAVKKVFDKILESLNWDSVK